MAPTGNSARGVYDVTAYHVHRVSSPAATAFRLEADRLQQQPVNRKGCGRTNRGRQRQLSPGCECAVPSRMNNNGRSTAEDQQEGSPLPFHHPPYHARIVLIRTSNPSLSPPQARTRPAIQLGSVVFKLIGWQRFSAWSTFSETPEASPTYLCAIP